MDLEWTGQFAAGVCVCESLCVCMSVCGGIRGVPSCPVNYKEWGGREKEMEMKVWHVEVLMMEDYMV